MRTRTLARRTSAKPHDGLGFHARTRYHPDIMAESSMTPDEFKEARERLGLSLSEMADMLGLSVEQVRRMEFSETANQRRPVMEQTRRLLEAYLSGYRPTDWPVKARRAG